MGTGTSKADKDVMGFQVKANERIFLDIYAANTNVRKTVYIISLERS